MVYLSVYDKISKFLDDKGVLGKAQDFSEEFLGALLVGFKSPLMQTELAIEFALFNYVHENALLIDFLSDEFYASLNKDERKEFDFLKKSERHYLKFVKKEKTGLLDEGNGKELFDFYFDDLDDKKTKIVISSSPLDKPEGIVNARLIPSWYYKNKYSIIGGIFRRDFYEKLLPVVDLKRSIDMAENSKNYVNELLHFSRENSLKEIEVYSNKESRFIEADRKIMKFNRLFFEKFGIGFDDFLENFFLLSNDKEKFPGMAEYFASSKELLNAWLDTNYVFGLPFVSETHLINAFAAFIAKDYSLLEKRIHEMKEQEKADYEVLLKNELAFTRENIMQNMKKLLKESRHKPDYFDSFFKKIDGYKPEQINGFLSEIKDYFEKNSSKTKDYLVYAAIAGISLENNGKLPYLQEVIEKQKNEFYDEEKFYEYVDVDEATRSLFAFMQAVQFIQRKEYAKAYGLIKREKIMKTDSFDELFLAGKIFNFFDDKEFKHYFLKAKSIDRERYKSELEAFLSEKEQGVLKI